MINENIIKKWHIGNDNGEGYAVGDDNMTPAEAAEAEGLIICDEDITGQVVAIASEDDDCFVVIRDHNGPWAVTVTLG